MFQTWRQKLREAEIALKAGRLDDAARIVSEHELKEYRPGAALAVKMAGRLAKRGKDRLAAGDSFAGWNDYTAASRLAGDAAAVDELRLHLAKHKEAVAQNAILAGDLDAATAALTEAGERGLSNSRTRKIEQIVAHWKAARRQARRGDFPAAEAEFAASAAMAPESKALAKERQANQSAMKESRPLREKLVAAAAEGRWSEVIGLAESLLALAPEDAQARQARDRAWRSAGLDARSPNRSAPAAAAVSENNSTPNANKESSETFARGPRNVLWVDEIGAFLICRGENVVLGQPGPGVDIPILADVSRRHAVIRREGEGYLILPARPIRVDDSAINETALLRDGSVIELAPGVRLQFRRPHALSNTATLSFLSRHRFQPHVDGVVLMAEACIMGPKPQSHIVCKQWGDDVVLMRQGDDLAVRTAGEFTCDEQVATGRCILEHDSRVAGQDFRFSVETLDKD